MSWAEAVSVREKTAVNVSGPFDGEDPGSELFFHISFQQKRSDPSPLVILSRRYSFPLSGASWQADIDAWRPSCH